MSDTVIDVRGVSKQYAIGARRESYRTLRDSLASAVLSRFRRNGSAAKGSSRDFWALKDVNFQIGRGEIVGIIGHNGAGKSTLLKILSRITDPTAGEIEIEGRLGSLLEVGTGFHVELTGRENVFLNGAILGMGKREIRRKFDDIAAFAEIDRFLDTPVKHYSSGMYVRLAFAVAAHLEPDILLVDEVLAVGDVSFQQKCLGKMKDVSSGGRTVLFVSHNVAAITRLCARCIVLSSGQIAYDGDTRTAITQHYMPIETAEVDTNYVAPAGRSGPHVACASVETSDGAGGHEYGKPMAFEFDVAVPTPCRGLCFAFQIVNEDSVPVCHFWVYNFDNAFGSTAGVHRLRCEVPRPRLYMATYTLTTWLSDRQGSHALLECLQGICKFKVNMLGISREQYDWQRGECIYMEDGKWKVELNVQENGKRQSVLAQPQRTI